MHPSTSSLGSACLTSHFELPRPRQPAWGKSGDSLMSQSSSSTASLSTCGGSSLAWGVKYPFMESEVLKVFTQHEIPLFQGLCNDWNRTREHTAFPLYDEQIYIVVNDPRLLETGKAHIFGPDGGLAFKIRASHGIHGGFVLVEAISGRELLLVNEVPKRAALIRRKGQSSIAVVRKMVIRNLGLYADVGRGDVVFSLEISKDDRAMDVTDMRSGTHLHIQGNLSDSATIYPRNGERAVGEVGNMLGRFMEDHSRFGFLLRDCSKEEAVVLLASSYAMFAHQNPDMKDYILISKQPPSMGQHVKSRLSLDGVARKSMDAMRNRRPLLNSTTGRPFRARTRITVFA